MMKYLITALVALALTVAAEIVGGGLRIESRPYLTFTCETGHAYRLLRKEALTDPQWEVVCVATNENLNGRPYPVMVDYILGYTDTGFFYLEIDGKPYMPEA